jgi:hypothetical protein
MGVHRSCGQSAWIFWARSLSRRTLDSQWLINHFAWILAKVGMQQPLDTFLAVDGWPFGGKTKWTSHRWACSGHFKPSQLIAGHSGGGKRMDFLEGGRTTCYTATWAWPSYSQKWTLMGHSCISSLWPSFVIDLTWQWKSFGKFLESNQAVFVADFLTIVLGVWAPPRPFLYRMDLNGNETLYAKFLGSNQAAFVADFLTIVLGVWAPSHSYTEWT